MFMTMFPLVPFRHILQLINIFQPSYDLSSLYRRENRNWLLLFSVHGYRKKARVKVRARENTLKLLIEQHLQNASGSLFIEIK
jgi:hypothetical protein